MQQLTTEPKTHVIITWNKGEYYITKRQNDAIVLMGLNDRITVDGNTIFGKSIAEVITAEEKTRRDYDIKTTITPDYYKDFTGIDKTLSNFSPERRKRAMEKVRAGFLKNFEGREMAYQAKLVLKNMDYRIGTAEW